MGDLLTSVVVLGNGLLLLFYPWYWLDPLLSVLIVVFILKNGWALLRESTAVLMNATPLDIDLEEVGAFLAAFPGVTGVHYLHAWRVSSHSIAFSCHVVVPDQPLSGTERLAGRIRHELLHRFGIDHPVLQFETADCGEGTLLCEISCTGSGVCTPRASSAVDSDSAAAAPGRVHPLVFQALRLLMGAVFLYASYDKILHPQAFAQAIYN
jgi:hypothetical protein